MIVLFSASMETQCNSCGKVISNKKNLAVHLKTHGDASIRCEICDKRFKIILLQSVLKIILI